MIDVQSDQITFLAQVKTRKDLGNAMSWHLFVDRGFDNTHSKTVIFEPIAHDGLNTACAIKKIDNSYLGIDAPSQNMAKLWFSEDGQNWQDMPLGTNFNFLSSSLSNFFLKVTLGVSGPVTFDKFYSPFLSLVSFNYYCEK